MKNRILYVFLAVALAGMLILSSCSKAATTTPSAQPTTTSIQPTTTTAPTPTIKQGGTLRIIAGSIPKDIGYSPEKAPNDNYQMLPVLEHLCEWGPDHGKLVPVLAESWEADHTANTITWHLKKGVKFTDGTPFNAEAVRWNVQLQMDNNRGAGINQIASLEVKDDSTLVMHMKTFDWQTVSSLGLVQPISPTSFLTAGGTIPSGSSNQTSVDWARSHAIGTGPFTLQEWARDDHITFVKNPNYWDTPKPYLDKIILTAIADPTVASAKLQAGEADMWADTSSINDLKDLGGKGYTLVNGPGYFSVMLFSDVDTSSPLNNIMVRQAIEYAIDRPTIAQTLGQGLYEPLTQMATKDAPGYNPGYNPRPYSVDKAKELLSKAGFGSGFTIKILGVTGGNINDAMALFIYDLGLVGITVQPDIADMGRYAGALFNAKGNWDGLCFTGSGINPDGSDLFTHYGPNPLTFRSPNMIKTDAFKQLCNAALDSKYDSAATAATALQAAVKQADEDCLFIPLWKTPDASIVAKYVHTEYPKIHGVVWKPGNDWMDTH
jgi:peptide/nickel transport system substrate-binding protein